ncbi:MAG TPA: phosphoglycolate phosphatase [Steroidobacteraceae bacterium]|nr:phosphoglycolate phosphatase [Steroidobacteraceae bacterium]
MPNPERLRVRPLRAVLFDLDGTLLDTAPDMYRALSELLREQGRAPVPFAAVRPCVSHGSTGVLRAGFGEVEETTFRSLQRRFLEIYGNALCVDTRLFPGMDRALDAIEARGLAAGIVTNKPAFLTEPLVERLGLRARFACVVCGDTLAERKPHPLPLLHAARLTHSSPAECIYVGDAARDVEAAHAAGMPALIARYGYHAPDEDLAAWDADGEIDSPAELIAWLAGSERRSGDAMT